MTGINIDVNDLVESLNQQVASLNLELHIAKLHIQALEDTVKKLLENGGGVSVDKFAKD